MLWIRAPAGCFGSANARAPPQHRAREKQGRSVSATPPVATTKDAHQCRPMATRSVQTLAIVDLFSLRAPSSFVDKLELCILENRQRASGSLFMGVSRSCMTFSFDAG